MGAGFMGATHLKAYKLLGRPLKLTVVDNDSSKKKIANKFGARFYNNIQQALKENNFDIVDICLPTFLHYQAAKQVLTESKSHLLIEKPLALNYQQAKELTRLIQKEKRIGMCAHVERFFQPMIRIKCWCSQNDPPYHFFFVRRTKKPKRSGWFTQEELGGDVLLDLGIHDIDLLLWFAKSEIVKIRASVENKRGRLNAQIIKAEIVFKDGSQAFLQSGWDIPEKSKVDLVNKIKIVSGKNKVIFDSTRNTLTFNEKTEKNQKPRYPDAYLEEIKHMVSCVLTGQKPKADFIQACKAIKIIDLIKESVEKTYE